MGLASGSMQLPLDDNEAAIRSAIWFGMDSFYDSAVEQLRRAKQNKATSVAEEFNAPDFFSGKT